MKYLKTVLSAIIVFAVLLSSNTAFAYNAEYLNQARWIKKDVVSHSVNQTGMFGTLKGKYSYFVDNEDMCLYVNFSVEEENIETNDDVKIGFIVNTNGEEYEFSVDANGDIISYVDVSKMFVAYSSFETHSLNNGVYTVALSIKDATNPSYISSYFITKGRYLLDGMTEIEVKKPDKVVPTTSVVSKTTATTTTTVKNSDKADKNDSKNSNKGKKAESSTKYYNPNPTSPNGNYSEELLVEDEIVFDSTTIVDNTPNVSKMYSKSYTIGLVVSCVLASVGFMLVLFGIFARKPKNEEEENIDE